MRSENLDAEIMRLCALGDAAVFKWGSWTLNILAQGDTITGDDVALFIDCYEPQQKPRFPHA
jgi:hypothetical protein